MPKAKSKLSVCFLLPISSAADTKEVKAGYKELSSQIIRFAEALKIDPNIIISNSVVSENPSDMQPVTYNLADAKIAELQSISKKIDDGKSSLTKPKQPITELPGSEDEDEEIEKPQVQAIEWTPSTTIQVPTSTEPSTTITAPAAPSKSDEVLVNSLLKNYDRVTAKSKAIIAFLVAKKDTDLTVDEIVAGTSLEKTSVTAWISQSAPKSVENVKRGVYRLNSAKIKIKE